MQLTVLTQNTTLGDITLRKTDDQYGSNCAYVVPQITERLGDTCGAILQHPAERTLYLVEDAI